MHQGIFFFCGVVGLIAPLQIACLHLGFRTGKPDSTVSPNALSSALSALITPKSIRTGA